MFIHVLVDLGYVNDYIGVKLGGPFKENTAVISWLLGLVV